MNSFGFFPSHKENPNYGQYKDYLEYIQTQYNIEFSQRIIDKNIEFCTLLQNRPSCISTLEQFAQKNGYHILQNTDQNHVSKFIQENKVGLETGKIFIGVLFNNSGEIFRIIFANKECLIGKVSTLGKKAVDKIISKTPLVN